MIAECDDDHLYNQNYQNYYDKAWSHPATKQVCA